MENDSENCINLEDYYSKRTLLAEGILAEIPASKESIPMGRPGFPVSSRCSGLGTCRLGPFCQSFHGDSKSAPFLRLLSIGFIDQGENVANWKCFFDSSDLGFYTKSGTISVLKKGNYYQIFFNLDGKRISVDDFVQNIGKLCPTCSTILDYDMEINGVPLKLLCLDEFCTTWHERSKNLEVLATASQLVSKYEADLTRLTFRSKRCFTAKDFLTMVSSAAPPTSNEISSFEKVATGYFLTEGRPSPQKMENGEHVYTQADKKILYRALEFIRSSRK